MTDSKIKRAAKQYASKLKGDTFSRADIEQAFEDGVNWLFDEQDDIDYNDEEQWTDVDTEIPSEYHTVLLKYKDSYSGLIKYCTAYRSENEYFDKVAGHKIEAVSLWWAELES